jgi:hypothetical protein
MRHSRQQKHRAATPKNETTIFTHSGKDIKEIIKLFKEAQIKVHSVQKKNTVQNVVNPHT